MHIPSKKELVDQIAAFNKNDEMTKRETLSSLHHMMDFCGWGDLIVTHCSVRTPDETGDFLIGPYGLMFSEIRPANLVRLNKEGKQVDKNEWRANYNGATSHSAIYEMRPDINCVIHTHTLAGVSVATLSQELFYPDQMSMMLYGQVAYHDYDSFFTHENPDTKEKFKQRLINKKCLVLRNHGLLVMGKSIPEAFWYYRYVELACEIQLKCLAAGIEVINVDDQLKQEIADQFDRWNQPEENGFPGHADLAFAAMQRRLVAKGYYN